MIQDHVTFFRSFEVRIDTTFKLDFIVGGDEEERLYKGFGPLDTGLRARGYWPQSEKAMVN